MLEAATYDAAEAAAADRLSNRIAQAFYPGMFQTLGYPMRVKSVDQLWRYIDGVHETRTRFSLEGLLRGLTTDEFDLYKRVVKLVDEHALEQFNLRAHATPALLRAIHSLRLIKIVAGNARPPVVEVGSGSGYLATLLVLEGFPYIGTDVAQAVYLFQNHMMSLVATNLRELVTEEGDILTVLEPKPGTAIHIPWWKWVTLSPERIRLSAGIMTCNHALCEMHPNSIGYLAAVSRRILSNFPGGGKFIFANWSYDEPHNRESVARKFAEHGLQVCHEESAMTAMVLAEEIAHWSGRSCPTAAPADVSMSAPAARPTPVQSRTRWQTFRGRVGAVLNLIPPLKRLAIVIYARLHQVRARVRARTAKMGRPEITTQSSSVPLVIDKPLARFPLSKRLAQGFAEVIDRATVHQPDIEAFLGSYFEGRVPRLPDEVFLDIIGVRFKP